MTQFTPQATTSSHPIFAEMNDINYQAPWLAHIPDILKEKIHYLYTDQQTHPANLANSLNVLLANIYPQGLQTGKGKPLKFVPQSVLDNINADTPTTPIAYETLIAETGQIPTRDNLHDLFNAWVWFTFPKTKALLNRHQAEQIAHHGITGSRGRVRDAITVLDENGAILITCNDNIAQSLKGFDWQHCLVQPRHLWDDPLQHNSQSNRQSDTKSQAEAMLMICGHALLEQLVNPRKPLCSHTFILQVEADFFQLSMEQRRQRVDELLAIEVNNWLQQAEVSPRQLSPLPVLGVPYYWAENGDVEFYNDGYVFRSGRGKHKQKSK